MNTEAQIRELIEQHYDIGVLVNYEKTESGTVNTSYSFQTLLEGKPKRYLLRRYKEDRDVTEIEFEHALLNHLDKKKFYISAGIKPTKAGKSYIIQSENQSSEGKGSIYAIFDFLPGENKYSWDNPACTQKELSHSADILAQYHHTVFDWNPTLNEAQLKIMDWLPIIREKVVGYCKQPEETSLDQYLNQHQTLILTAIDQIIKSVNPIIYSELPMLAIHGDYHPGNLMFINETVSGLFDFDWARMDVRVYDVAFSLVYFCAEWKDTHDRKMNLDKIQRFLQSYQKSLDGNSGLAPLNHLEIDHLVVMIEAANIYLLYWGIEDYYAKKPDPETYLFYLKHNIHLIQYLKNETSTLKRVIQAV